jgi:hypothetical protein
MKNSTLTLIALCFLGFVTPLQAQNAIPASGGNASGSGGSASYTVGQVLYTTNAGTNSSVAQGVQQPYEVSVITGLDETKDISLDILIYPNPATDFVRLKIVNYEVQNLRYQLYDINGILLQDNKIEGEEASIVMSNYEPSTYLLKVTDSNKTVKIFKIIKH